MQIIGTLFGAVINYILMSSITTNQRDILLSIQGTNIWSGQVIQSFNSNVSSRSFSLVYTCGVVNFSPGHRLRRTLRVHVQRGQNLYLDCARSSPWLRRATAVLLPSPAIPVIWLRLSRHPTDLLVPGLSVSGHQLLGMHIFRYWVLRPVLGSKEASEMVLEIQLPPGRGHQRRNRVFGLCHHVRSAGRQWQSDSISRILGKQFPGWKS